MSTGPLQCPKCPRQLPADFMNRPEPAPCPSCDTPVMIEVFPAQFLPPPPVQTGAQILVDGEAGCFYHPAKLAVVPCEHCGRFLCALCDVELHGQHLCPSCLEVGKKKGRLTNLQNRRVLYDSMALTLSLAPLLMWPFTFVTAPATIYVVIRYWKEPSSIIPRTKARLWAALIIAILQIVAWALVVAAMLKS